MSGGAVDRPGPDPLPVASRWCGDVTWTVVGVSLFDHHNLVVPEARKRKREDYKQWERSKAMELWQMDIGGGVRIKGSGEARIVSGIDDHSRFIISA